MPRWPRHARLLLLAVTLGIVGTGCAARRPAGAPPPPARLPSAAQLEEVLASRREAVHSLRALSRLRYRDADQSTSSRQALIVARPDRLRVEVTSLFGAVFVLTADDGALSAFRDNTVYRGQASPENVQRYIHMGLPVSELVDLVLGTPPVRQGRHAQVAFDPQAGAVRLWQDLAHGALLVWFSAADLPVAAEERGVDGQAHWHATFGGYEQRNGYAVATRIGLEMPLAHQSLQMTLEDVDLNPVLDRSVFALQTPPGSKVVSLDAIAD
ncbi:MAG: lipoprotein insertase outer membrane protein LolB [Candidatus Binatia bacterium]